MRSIYLAQVLLLLSFAPMALAAEEPELSEMPQVTSVSQLSDVKPTDWAFQALQSLVERYGCIAGYPNGTYKGDRPITRYEFAAGLNACITQINELIRKSNSVPQTDLQQLQRLQETFAKELADIQSRVTALEGKSDRLLTQQFSTTTKLSGQVILGLQGRSANTADLNPRDGVKETRDPATAASFGYSAQLSLYTQLPNRSIFLLGLQAGNLSTAAGNTNLPYFLNDTYTRLAYESNTANQVLLSDATYRFIAAPRLAMIVGAAGVNPVGVFRGPNRYEGAGSGPVSSFAQRNPILNLGGQAGVGFDWQLGRNVSVQGVYSAGSGTQPASDPTSGLFNGGNTIGLQLAAVPLPRLDWTAYYLSQYSPSSQLGTGVGDDLIGFVESRFRTNAVGTTVSWRTNSRLTIGGWVGYTHSAVRVPNFSGAVETMNWMGFLNFPDLLGQGNLGGIYFGQPPRITSSNLALNGVETLNIPGTVSGRSGAAGGQPDATFHLEAFYRWQIKPNFSITPGVVVLFNPVQIRSSDPITIGTLRSTFSF